MNFVIVIPARGGSKRVKKKNMALLAGKPLLLYTLNILDELGMQKYGYVSTDDEKIAALAKKHNVACIKRPPSLSGDEVSTEKVLLHAIQNIRMNDVEWVITLPPTSPLRTSNLVGRFIDNLKTVHSEVDCLMTVTVSRGDYWKFDSSGEFKRLFPTAPRRQQDRTPLFEENSAIYATRMRSLLQTKNILGNKVVPMEISAREGFDINTPEDLVLAERLLDPEIAENLSS